MQGLGGAVVVDVEVHEDVGRAVEVDRRGRVARAAIEDREVRAEGTFANILRRNAADEGVAEVDGVGAAEAGVNGVVAGRRHDQVDTKATVEGVVAGAAVEHVVAVAAEEAIVAGAAFEDVVAAAAVEEVVAALALEQVGGAVAGQAVGEVGAGDVLDVGQQVRPAELVRRRARQKIDRDAEPGVLGILHGVDAGAALDGVVAGATEDEVVAAAAVEGVVAGVAGEHVAEGAAGDDVVADGAGERRRHRARRGVEGQRVEIDQAAQAEGLQRAVAVEVEAHEIERAGELRDRGLVENARRVLQGELEVEDALRRVEGGGHDTVDLEAGADHQGVGAAAGKNGVVARRRHEHIVAGAAVEGVAAGAAVEGVVAGAAHERVVTAEAQYPVVAAETVDGLAVGGADQEVGAGAGARRVEAEGGGRQEEARVDDPVFGIGDGDGDGVGGELAVQQGHHLGRRRDAVVLDGKRSARVVGEELLVPSLRELDDRAVFEVQVIDTVDEDGGKVVDVVLGELVGAEHPIEGDGGDAFRHREVEGQHRGVGNGLGVAGLAEDAAARAAGDGVRE